LANPAEWPAPAFDPCAHGFREFSIAVFKGARWFSTTSQTNVAHANDIGPGYSDPQSGVLIEDLFQWSDHSNASVFKMDVIQQLHRQLFVEYDQESEII
jgi:hypothetical protein